MLGRVGVLAAQVLDFAERFERIGFFERQFFLFREFEGLRKKQLGGVQAAAHLMDFAMREQHEGSNGGFSTAQRLIKLEVFEASLVLGLLLGGLDGDFKN